jgi:hypothetical protein
MSRSAPPPSDLRKAKLDNLALVPGSLLPFKDEWPKLANEMPEGTTLIILPPTGPARRALQKVGASMRARGQRVTTLSHEQLPG